MNEHMWQHYAIHSLGYSLTVITKAPEPKKWNLGLPQQVNTNTSKLPKFYTLCPTYSCCQ